MIGKVTYECCQRTNKSKCCDETGPSAGNSRRWRQRKGQLEGQCDQINEGSQEHARFVHVIRKFESLAELSPPVCSSEPSDIKVLSSML